MDLSQGPAVTLLGISRHRRYLFRGLPLAVWIACGIPVGSLAQVPASAPRDIGAATPQSTGAAPDDANTPSLTGIESTAPQPRVGPPFQLSGSVSFEQTYTTNAFGAPSGTNAPSDTFSRGMLQLSFSYLTRLTQAVGNYSFWADYYASHHNLSEYVNYLNLGARTELIPDHLSLNVTGFASPIVTSRAGVISAGGQLLSSSNISNTYGYVVQPEYKFRLSDIATSITDVSESGVFFVFPDVSNPVGVSATNVSNASLFAASQRFRSGEYFGRLQWTVTGDFNQLKQQSLTEKQTDGILDLAYAVDRSFQILATGGYNDFKVNVPLTRPLSGPEGMGGFRYTPSPSLQLMVEGGIRNRTPTYLGSVQWKLTERTSLLGALTDGISTPQGSIMSGLSGFGTALLNPGGAVSPLAPIGVVPQSINPALGTVSPLLSQGLAINNFLYHYRQGTVTLSHQMERTDVALSFYEVRQTQVQSTPGIDTSASLYGITATASRRMWSNLGGYVSLSYSKADEFGGHDQIYQGDVGLNFSLSDTLMLYAADRYLYRQSAYASATPSGKTWIEEIAVGIRRNF